MFAASTAPSAAPAPTSMCNSSMKSTQLPLVLISSMTFFRRSSNSPRYLVPATSEPMSSVSRRLPCSVSGTSPATMRCARPSTMAVLPTPGSPMRTGCSWCAARGSGSTRSISSVRPMTGSSLPARAAAVRSMPSWSTVGVRVLARRAGGGALRRALREDARRLGAHALEVDAQAFEHTGGDAFALADEAEEQVLGADVAVVEPARLFDGELDDLLGARRQANLAGHRLLAAADDEFDGGADLVELDAEVVEDLGGYTVAFANEAEEQVLGANVVVVEALGFFLCEGQNAARSFRKLVESVCHFAYLAPPILDSALAQGYVPRPTCERPLRRYAFVSSGGVSEAICSLQRRERRGHLGLRHVVLFLAFRNGLLDGCFSCRGRRAAAVRTWLPGPRPLQARRAHGRPHARPSRPLRRARPSGP